MIIDVLTTYLELPEDRVVSLEDAWIYWPITMKEIR